MMAEIFRSVKISYFQPHDTLKMEAGWYPIYQTPRCHTPRDGVLRNKCREILRSHTNIYLCTVQMSEVVNWLTLQLCTAEDS